MCSLGGCPRCSVLYIDLLEKVIAFLVSVVREDMLHSIPDILVD